MSSLPQQLRAQPRLLTLLLQREEPTPPLSPGPVPSEELLLPRAIILLQKLEGLTSTPMRPKQNQISMFDLDSVAKR